MTISPEARAKAKRTRALKTKVPTVKKQFEWNSDSEVVFEQSIKCLQCASSVMLNEGFFCAIHPLGKDMETLPCSDWSEK